jgi:hypothetical protein
MDVNAIIYCDGDRETDKAVQIAAADNIKRVVRRTDVNWLSEASHPYLVRDTQEVKTTWHPVGT